MRYDYAAETKEERIFRFAIEQLLIEKFNEDGVSRFPWTWWPKGRRDGVVKAMAALFWEGKVEAFVEVWLVGSKEPVWRGPLEKATFEHGEDASYAIYFELTPTWKEVLRESREALLRGLANEEGPS